MSSPSLSYSFAGKRVLITGGGRGVGLELVTRLYNDGAHVFTLERDPSLVEKLRKDLPNIKAEMMDVSNWTETQKVIDSFGPLDHLVNCAGIVIPSEFLQVQEDQFEKQINVNLKAMFATSQAVAKGMIPAGIKGSIVNVASLTAHNAFPALSIYSVTKAGVVMLTKCLAVELGKHGIRCNSVSPTAVDTPMFQQGRETVAVKEGSASLISRQPLAGNTILTPGEVVDTILYLLSPLSSMTNGVDIILDGGISIC